MLSHDLNTNSKVNSNSNSTLIPTPLNQQFGFIDDNQNRIFLDKMTIKRAYKRLLSKAITLLLRRKKKDSLHQLKSSIWEEIWNLSNLRWKEIWLSCFDLPINNKKKELQWKILQNAIHTMSRVSKYRPETSPLCLFCKKEPESIRHLWYYCDIATFLWSWVNRLINHSKKNHEKEITLSEFDIMTNGYNLEIESEFKKKQWRIMICEIKWQIWLARNKILWNNESTITPIELLLKTKAAFLQQLTDFQTTEKTNISNEENRMINDITRPLENNHLWTH